MRNIFRAIVAVCLLGTVTGFAANGVTTINLKNIVLSGENVVMNLHVAGVNGALKGNGQIRILRAITYPVTVTSGSYDTPASGGTTATTVTTINLAGTIKRRSGIPLSFTLVATTDGDVDMSVMNLTTTVALTGGGQVQIKR